QKQEVAAILDKVVREGDDKFSDNTFDVDNIKKSVAPGAIPEVADQSQEYTKQRNAFERAQEAKTKAKSAPATLLQEVVSGVTEITQTEETSNLSVKAILAQEEQAAAAQSV